jgi:hypothetical protein
MVPMLRQSKTDFHQICKKQVSHYSINLNCSRSKSNVLAFDLGLNKTVYMVVPSFNHCSWDVFNTHYTHISGTTSGLDLAINNNNNNSPREWKRPKLRVLSS